MVILINTRDKKAEKLLNLACRVAYNCTRLVATTIRSRGKLDLIMFMVISSTRHKISSNKQRSTDDWFRHDS